MFSQGNSCTLWCDAVSQIVKKRKQKRDSNSSDELSDTDSQGKSKKKKLSAMEERKEQVEEIKSKLCEMHGTSFSPLQYTLWAEMVAVHGYTQKPRKSPTSTDVHRKSEKAKT